MGYEQEIWSLRNRVKELEKQVEHLRLSRRVLMNLIERLEKEKRLNMNLLEKENRRLQLNNQKYAKWLMSYNCRLVEAAADERQQPMEVVSKETGEER